MTASKSMFGIPTQKHSSILQVGGGMTANIVIACLVLLAVTLLAPSLMAQSLVSGDITGTVTDPSGAVVANATVTLKSNATGETRSTKTNASGSYRFSLLSPGSYTLDVSAQGFAKAQNTVVANIGAATISNVKLAVGQGSQTVEVTSASPLVSAENADLSTTFNNTLIQELPNPGNDLTYIAQTAPGVNMNTGMGYGNFESSGLPATSNVFTINGENAMDPYLNLNYSGATNLLLGRNEMQEATVVTNAYSGQYGQQAGVQLNYTTKSGTNEFHGNAIYAWTGSSLDANNWFNNNTSPVTPRPFNNNNQWAASFGGPIKKNKTFFFVDNEGIRYIVPSSQTVYSPSPAFATATLANLTTADPSAVPLYSRMFNLYQSAPGYNRGTPVANGGCLDFTPTTFSGPCFQQYQANPSEPAEEYILVGRIDQNFSDNDKAFFRVKIDHGTQATYADPINPAFDAASYQPAYDGQAQWTHVFNSNATNQFIAALSHYQATFQQTPDAASTFPSEVLMSPLGYTNMAGDLSVFPQGRNVTQYQFIDDYAVTKGHHSLRFGGNFRRYDITDYVFSEFTNPLAVVTSVSDFYNGIAGEYVQNFPSRNTMPLAIWGLGAYVQDEWQIARNLKLTLGLRMEHDSNPVCNLNCSSLLNGNFYSQSTDPSTAYNQMISANRAQFFRATNAINWAPRFGFAWSPFGNGNTVVRGGFGIFYDAAAAFLGDSYMTNIPTVIPMTLFGVNWADTTSTGAGAVASASAAAIRNGFANGASFNSLSATVPGFSAPAYNNQAGTFNTPLYQEWSLQIEQQLDSKSALTLAYVGNHGIDLPITNYPNVAGSLTGIPATPYSSSFSTIAETYTGGVSNYNGVTATYTRRMTYGFNVMASYTWGHAMDDVSNGGLLPYNATSSLSYQLNPFCLRCNNYGPADYDIRNSFNAAYTWQMPFHFSKGILNETLGGWTLSQNFFVRSGLPLTVLDSTTALSNYNPNAPYPPAQVIGNNPQQGCSNGNTQCLNPSAFQSASAYGAFPTQARNMFRGPGFFDSDVSLNKNFKITERFVFNFGANFYNIFNHPNFANPVSTYGAGNFGYITQTTAPPTGPFGSFFAGAPSGRIIQLQGKITF